MQRVARLSGFCITGILSLAFPITFLKSSGSSSRIDIHDRNPLCGGIVGQPDESLLPTGLTGRLRRSGSPLLPSRLLLVFPSIRPSVPSNRDIPRQRSQLELLRAVHSTWFLRRRRLPRTNPGVTPRGAAWRRSHSCVVTSTSATKPPRGSGEPGVRGVPTRLVVSSSVCAGCEEKKKRKKNALRYRSS